MRYLTVLSKLKGAFSLSFVGQLIILLATAILVDKVFAAEALANADSMSPLRCSEVSGTRELNSVLFMMKPEKWGFSHSTLISDLKGPFNWLEINYSKSGIRIHNQLPGMGIPVTLYAIKSEILDENGNVMSEQYLEQESECSGISLFPGQSTRTFKLDAVDLDSSEMLKRLRLRILASPN